MTATCELCSATFDTQQGKSIHRGAAHEDDEVESFMLDELRDLASELGRPPTADELDESSGLSQNTYQKRFGSWNDALRAAGLSVQKVSGTTTVVCANCDTELERFEYRLAGKERHFCDSACMGEWQEEAYAGDGNPRYQRRETACDYCGAKLYRAPWELDASDRQYCDSTCQGKHRSETGEVSGPNSPRWRGGSRFYERLREFAPGPYSHTRRQVLEEASRECRNCGAPASGGARLEVHHIVPVYAGGSNGTANLMVLCAGCHYHAESFTSSLFTRVLDPERYH